MAKTSPAFQFYVADWLASQRVTLMSLEEEGAYIRLLTYCWRDGTIPSDAKQLAMLIGKRVKPSTIATVKAMFLPHPTLTGRLLHDRLDAERGKQEEHSQRRAAAGSKGAMKRWQEPPATNGNAMLEGMAKPPNSNSNAIVLPMANDSSSSSSSSSDFGHSSHDDGKPDEQPVDLKPVSQAVKWFQWESISPAKRGDFITLIRAVGVPAAIAIMNRAPSEAKKPAPAVWRDWSLSVLASEVAKQTVPAPTRPTARPEGGMREF